jgi:hypothetical protein
MASTNKFLEKRDDNHLVNERHTTKERRPQSQLLRKHKTHIIPELLGAYGRTDRRMDGRKKDRNEGFNLLKTERRSLYLKAQSVPRCKHFSSRLYDKNQSVYAVSGTCRCLHNT